MKSINNYISEKLVINKNTGKKYYKYFPETNDELQDIIKQRIEKEGNKCNLNDIDVSKITDMSYLFMYSEFNGDISEWNVSNVKYMNCMFRHSKFNQDISSWDVSNVEDMLYIFDDSPLEGKEKEWWNIKEKEWWNK